MPRYEFMCEKCNKSFELIMTFSEREKGDVKCPKCLKGHAAVQCVRRADGAEELIVHGDWKSDLRRPTSAGLPCVQPEARKMNRRAFVTGLGAVLARRWPIQKDALWRQ
jgi:putative FmdB family regulatory protein